MIEFTSDMDERIRALYTPPYVRGAIVRQAEAWNIEFSLITRRARKLGLKPLSWHVGSKKWTAEEVRLIRSVPHKSNEEVSRLLRRHGYERSRYACSIFRRRHGWQASVERDQTMVGYSASTVSELLGLGKSTVLRFIRLGYIKAKRENNNHEDVSVTFRVSEKNLREFMMQHVHRWEPGKCDKYWLIDFLTNTKAMHN